MTSTPEQINTFDRSPGYEDVPSVAREASARLQEAEQVKSPCAPVRDLIGESDLNLAYDVQRLGVQARILAGATPVGRKIGLTSPAVQRQLGVDRPDFGVLFDDMQVSSGASIAAGRLLQAKVEAEVAFVLSRDLDDDEGLDIRTIRDRIDYAVAALEIVDSRIAGWDIRITDTIADNGSSGLFVLGDKRVPVTDFNPVDVTMKMYADDEAVSEGNGAACLGDPLNALLWLARTSIENGTPLRAGEVVLTGALGPMHAVKPGITVRAEIYSLGTVSVRFAQSDEEQI